MNILNDKMLRLYREQRWQSQDLADDLGGLLTDGFVRSGNCFFLQKLVPAEPAYGRVDFIDDTGFECFINSVHIDDYCETDFIVQGSIFLEKVFARWNQLNANIPLRGIISETEFGAIVKFHVKRPNEYWIQEKDLEKFDEAMLLSDSC